MNPDDLDQGSDDGDDGELDFSTVKTSKFVFPDGKYEMTCVKVVKDVSGAGNKMLVWTWRGGDEVDNSSFKQFMALTEGGMWRVLKNCEALELASAGEKLKISELSAKAIGRRAICTLKKEKRDGVERSNISDVAKHKEGPGEGRDVEFPPT